ncbi:PLIN3 protein, partial [Sapayoa aenigma]|nr:PLIN3 protein [Sapayoa aenigma]
SDLPLPQMEVFKQEFNQKLQEEQQKLHQMWLDWRRNCDKEIGDESSAGPEEMESLTLLLACRIIQQLQMTCSNIMFAVQSLLSSLEYKVKQCLGITKELFAAFSVANSLQDMSRSVTQSQRKLAVIQKDMDELLDYLKNNTPLS